ncbi:MAG: beta-galactosidase [bacterium]|nr:beta-galactosidase [bacterium]
MLNAKHIRKQAFFGFLVIATVCAVLAIGFLNTIIDELRAPPKITFGVTFSPSYATNLGLDWRKTYLALLDDMQVRNFRLPAYWEDIELNPDEFYFDDLDWMINEAQAHDAKIILAVGFRLPRWPECHAPAWAHELPEAERRQRILKMMRTVVERYQNSPAIVAWQVENEPLLEFFGVCPTPDREFLKQEVSLVRALDKRPIMVTESGELSTWLRTVGISDYLGISMYRVSWNPYLGYIFYPLSPGFYRHRAKVVRPFTKKIIVTELQAEPWVIQGILNTPLDEQFRSMNATRLVDNINFVSRAGFSEVYFWGVEWWYWLKEKKGNTEFWDIGKAIFKSENSQ